MATESTFHVEDQTDSPGKAPDLVISHEKAKETLTPTHVVRMGDDSLVIDGNPLFAERAGEKDVRCFSATTLEGPPELLALGDLNEQELAEAGKKKATDTRSKVKRVLLPAAAAMGLVAIFSGCSKKGGDLTTSSSDSALQQMQLALESQGLEPVEGEFSQIDQSARGMYIVDVDGSQQGMIPIIKPDPNSPTGQVELFILQADLEVLLEGIGEIPEAVKVELPEDPMLLSPNLTGMVFDPETNKIYYSHAGNAGIEVVDYHPDTKTVSPVNSAEELTGLWFSGVPLSIINEDDGSKTLIVKNADGNIKRINLSNDTGEDTSLSAQCGGYTRLDDGTYLMPQSMGGYCLVTSGDTLVDAIGSYDFLQNLNQPDGPDGSMISINNPIAIVPPIIHNGIEYHLMYTGKTGTNGTVVGNFMGVWIPVIVPECGDGACNGNETPFICPTDCGEPGSDVTEPGDVVEDTSETFDTSDTNDGDEDTGGDEDAGADTSGEIQEDVTEPGDANDGGAEIGPEIDEEVKEEVTVPPLECNTLESGMPQFKITTVGEGEHCVPQVEIVDGNCSIKIQPASGDKFNFKITGDGKMACSAVIYLDGFVDEEGNPIPADILIEAKASEFIDGDEMWAECKISFNEEEQMQKANCPDLSAWTWAEVVEDGHGIGAGAYGAITSGPFTHYRILKRPDGKTIEVQSFNEEWEGFIETTLKSGKSFLFEPGGYFAVDTLAEEVEPMEICDDDTCGNPDADVVEGEVDAGPTGDTVSSDDLGGGQSDSMVGTDSGSDSTGDAYPEVEGNGNGGGCGMASEGPSSGAKNAAAAVGLVLLGLMGLKRRKDGELERVKK